MARPRRSFHPADLQPIAFGVLVALSLFGAFALYVSSLALLFMHDDLAAGRTSLAIYAANLLFMAGPAAGALVGWILYRLKRYVAALAVGGPLLLIALTTFAWIESL